MLGKRKFIEKEEIHTPNKLPKNNTTIDLKDSELKNLMRSLNQCALDLDQALWVDLLDSAAQGDLKNIQRLFKYNRHYFKHRTGLALIKAVENGEEKAATFILKKGKEDIFPCQILWAKKLAEERKCYSLLRKIDILQNTLSLQYNFLEKERIDINYKI